MHVFKVWLIYWISQKVIESIGVIVFIDLLGAPQRPPNQSSGQQFFEHTSKNVSNKSECLLSYSLFLIFHLVKIKN